MTFKVSNVTTKVNTNSLKNNLASVKKTVAIKDEIVSESQKIADSQKMTPGKWAIVGVIFAGLLAILGTALHKKANIEAPEFNKALTETYKLTPEQIQSIKTRVYYGLTTKQKVLDSLAESRKIPMEKFATKFAPLLTQISKKTSGNIPAKQPINPLKMAKEVLLPEGIKLPNYKGTASKLFKK